MKRIKRFVDKYQGHLLHVWLEDSLGWFVRSLPGITGMTLRWLLYRSLFAKLESFCLIYPGVYFTHTYGLRVGKSFSVNTGAFIDARGGIIIGDNVMIGPHAVIVSSRHDIYSDEKPMTFRDHIMDPVIIGNDVWIGTHVVITEGITIGDGAVLAAGAVVTRNIDAYAIIGGVPAKTLKYRNSNKSIDSN